MYAFARHLGDVSLEGRRGHVGIVPHCLAQDIY